MDIKAHLAICSLQRTQFKYKDKDKLKINERQNISLANIRQKKVVVILTSDKVDFRAENIIRIKEFISF